MKINEKYLIDKIIETLKDDPEYNTGSLVWWYSDSLDIMQPCRMGTLPDLGVDDWELVVVSQDLEYYLPNDSPNSGVKRKSGRYPWGSNKKNERLDKKMTKPYKAGVIIIESSNAELDKAFINWKSSMIEPFTIVSTKRSVSNIIEYNEIVAREFKLDVVYTIDQ